MAVASHSSEVEPNIHVLFSLFTRVYQFPCSQEYTKVQSKQLTCKKYEPVENLTVYAVDKGHNRVVWNHRVEFIFASGGEKISLRKEESYFVLEKHTFTDSGTAKFASTSLEDVDFDVVVKPRSIVVGLRFCSDQDVGQIVKFGDSLEVTVFVQTEDGLPFQHEQEQFGFIDEDAEEDDGNIAFSIVSFDDMYLKAKVTFNKGAGNRSLRAVYQERRIESLRQLEWSNGDTKVLSEIAHFECIPGK